ncbi:MAG: hypothetical protein LBB16_02945 [Puniceicoccales bacterium]|jgi:hypothetical protein|nr:hypothetical protein [Puniceicoccales bacterium]
MKSFISKGEVELRVPSENEAYDVFTYEIDENVFVQNKRSCAEFNEALSAFEDNTEVYCDWLQTLAED